jgi:hypothetical protein
MAGITRRKHLNPRRRNRSFPRVIKRIRHNNYRVKRPGDTGTRHDGPPVIKLTAPATRPPRATLKNRAKIKIS